MHLDINLKKLMTENRLGLGDLSKLSKVPKQTLHNWICGADPKNLDQVRSVAQAFGLSIEELCYGEKSKSLNKHGLKEFEDEINAGVFEVVLRRVKK